MTLPREETAFTSLDVADLKLGGVATTTALAALAALTAAEAANLDASAFAEARTATSGGLTTGTIAGGKVLNFIPVTSSNADFIIVLPAPVPGTIVILAVGANGYELRSSAPASVAIGGGTGATAESAIPANSIAIAVCASATSWLGITVAAGTAAGIEAAA